MRGAGLSPKGGRLALFLFPLFLSFFPLFLCLLASSTASLFSFPFFLPRFFSPSFSLASFLPSSPGMGGAVGLVGKVGVVGLVGWERWRDLKVRRILDCGFVA